MITYWICTLMLIHLTYVYRSEISSSRLSTTTTTTRAIEMDPIPAEHAHIQKRDLKSLFQFKRGSKSSTTTTTSSPMHPVKKVAKAAAKVTGLVTATLAGIVFAEAAAATAIVIMSAEVSTMLVASVFMYGGLCLMKA